MTKTREPWTNEQWAVLAAEDGNIDFLRFAIERGADLNKPVDHPFLKRMKLKFRIVVDRPISTTALFEAVCAENLEAVKVLLDFGADPYIKLEDAVSAATAADGEVAKAIAARQPDPEAAERDAFAARMKGRYRVLWNRDLGPEAFEWAERISDPFAPIFAGESLFALLVEKGKQVSFRGAISEVIGRARTPADMLAALEAALANELDDEAAALVERGALAGMAKERLDDLLAKTCRRDTFNVHRTRDLLLAAGANPRPFVMASYATGRFNVVEKFVLDNPAIVASAADDDGFGIVWHALWRLAWRLNDTEHFSSLLSQAKTLLALPSARVLTGTGLGRFGPPACAFMEKLEDRNNIHNAKRLKRAAALAEEILAMALAEADGLGADGSDPNAGLPEGFNILHLAVVCGDSRVSGKLVDKAAAMGADAFRRMALAPAPAQTLADAVERHGRGSDSKSDPIARGALEHILHQKKPTPHAVNLAVKFARHMGTDTALNGSHSVFAGICLWLDDVLEGEITDPLRRLFDLGADPETKINQGQVTLQEALQRRKSARAQRAYSPHKEEMEERWKLVEQAFLDAAGKGGGGGPVRKKRETI